MCFVVYFSTTSSEDLYKIQSDHFEICSPDRETDAEALRQLDHLYRWQLTSRFGGCSCHFRHAASELGFGTVEDWLPEDPEDVKSTRRFFDLIHRVLGQGHHLDVLDIWNGTANEEVRSIEVELGNVPRDHFRFLEGCRMGLTP